MESKKRTSFVFRGDKAGVWMGESAFRPDDGRPFSWGGDGDAAGQRRLAFALLTFITDEHIAKRHEYTFALEVIARLDRKWTLSGNDILRLVCTLWDPAVKETARALFPEPRCSRCASSIGWEQAESHACRRLRDVVCRLCGGRFANSHALYEHHSLHRKGL